jgi:tellurite resistance protein TerC
MTFALAFQNPAPEVARHSIGTPLAWAGFLAFVFLMLLLDLGIFHKKAHVIRIREAAAWTIVWICLALLFNLGIWIFGGPDRHVLAIQFLTGYLIEKALSVDNIFVFIVVFSYFKVPPMYQHRVLFWGILGALVMRGLFIWLGMELLKVHFMMYIFGAFLVFTGIRILIPRNEEIHPDRNLAMRAFRWMFRVAPAALPGSTTPVDYGKNFLVKIDGKTWATPLLMVLFVVEVTDLVFAVDSIPAILVISTDAFIIYTSNIFAILGLRALYFVVGGMMDKFHYLKIGLGLILVFIGIKMAGQEFLMRQLFDDPERRSISPVISLAVVVALLGGSIAASLIWPTKKTPEKPA